LFAFALLARLALVAIVPFDGLYGQDAYAYYDYAFELAGALGAGQPPPGFFWPLGYPLHIVFTALFAGWGTAASQLASLIAGALAVALTFALGREAAGREDEVAPAVGLMRARRRGGRTVAAPERVDDGHDTGLALATPRFAGAALCAQPAAVHLGWPASARRGRRHAGATRRSCRPGRWRPCSFGGPAGAPAAVTWRQLPPGRCSRCRPAGWLSAASWRWLTPPATQCTAGIRSTRCAAMTNGRTFARAADGAKRAAAGADYVFPCWRVWLAGCGLGRTAAGRALLTAALALYLFLAGVSWQNCARAELPAAAGRLG
jgi:hypothetical protein